MTVSSSTIASLRGRASMLWLDSGATHHVVNDAGMLRNSRSPSVSQVVLGGGEEHAVLCEGDLLLKGGPVGSVLLTNVLHVPTLGINLVSTSQITSKNFSCWEGPYFAHIYDPSGRIVLRGHKIDGMYRIDCTLSPSPTASVNYTSTSAELWHRRFGHIGHASLQQMMRVDAVKGIDDIKFSTGHAPCDVCDQAKMTRAHFPRSSTKASYPTELVHSDTMGPMPIRGLEDELYVITALDDFSGYSETLLTRTKSEAASALVDMLIRWQRLTGRKMKTLRTDQGTEFQGVLTEYCTRKGITHQTSTVYTPEQNGRAERLNRTLIERVRALLLEHHLPKTVWSEAMMTASYLRNRITASNREATPHELFYGTKPNVSHLRVYGCKAFAYVEKGHRDKLDAVADECALVGYSATSKAYRLLRPGTNGQLTVVEAISVRFHEDSAPTFLNAYIEDDIPPIAAGGGAIIPLDPVYYPNDSESASSDEETAANTTESGANAEAAEDAAGTGGTAGGTEDVEHGEEASVAGSNAMGETTSNAAPVPEPDVPVVPDLSELQIELPAEDDPMVAAEEEQPRRYPKRDRHPPTEWYRVNVPRLHVLQGLTDSPATYKEAISRPDGDQWEQAIADELASLQSKGVYTAVSPPMGVTPLPSKLVLNIKRDENGNIEKYKARLVAKGFRQIAGRDYDEVFAPTAQHVKLRVLLAIASSQGFEVDQLDVKTAFRNGGLSEEVYLKLPAELGSTVWRLHKALYGLKQAARAWFAKLRDSMLAHGFTPS
jgi:transposase InsO family protein